MTKQIHGVIEITYLPARFEKDVSSRLEKDAKDRGFGSFIVYRHVVRLGPVDLSF